MLQSDAVSVSQDDIPQSNPEELWRALNMKAPGVYNVKTIVLVQWKLSDCDDGIKYGKSHKNFLLLNIPFVLVGFAHALMSSIFIIEMTSSRVQHKSHITPGLKTLYWLP